MFKLGSPRFDELSTVSSQGTRVGTQRGEHLTQPLIICGMHRSGTSMLTRILAAHGLFIGHRLGKHPEALFFHRLNEELLRGAGASWDQPEAALATLREPGEVERLAKRLRPRLRGLGTWSYLGPRIVAARARIGPNLRFAWGWKDPRNSLLLPVWLALFPEARVLRIRRHGIDVAASLAAREARRAVPGRCAASAEGLALWAEYEAVLDGWLAAVPADRQLTVRFEDYAVDPHSAQAALNVFVGLGPVRPIPVGLRPDPGRSFAYRANSALRAEAERFAALLRTHGYEP